MNKPVETAAKARAGLAAATAWWQSLARRERMLLAWGGVMVALGLMWSLAVQPAWRALQRTPGQLEALDQQLQHMRTLANEAQALRAVPPVSPEQASAVLKSAASRLGSKGKLVLQGDRAVLTLTALEPGALQTWLAEVRSGARARTVQASLTRSGGGYSGSLVLAFGDAP